VLANRSMPEGTVIPVLVYEDVGEAADWLCEAFGFLERWRAGGHRAQLAIGEAAVALTAGSDAPPSGDSVMVRVNDVDRHHEHAKEHGARIVAPPADYPYGERQYTAEDPSGRRWTFSESIADVAPEEWGGAGAGV
jgi:uncharacterized glyoxalase superfamily protein PhnB